MSDPRFPSSECPGLLSSDEPHRSYQLRPREKVVSTSYYDTHPSITYSPRHACHRGLFGWCYEYDPWTREDLLAAPISNPTFHHTSSWESDEEGQDLRTLAFSFRGTCLHPTERLLHRITYVQLIGVSLAIYGASRAQIGQINPEKGYQHGHQEICVDQTCYAVDAHQPYLNINDEDASQPVLLWSREFPSYEIREVTLRLLDGYSRVGGIRRMTFNKFVVGEVRRDS